MSMYKNQRHWRPRTLAVRGGQRRTSFQETSEALFLTSGYAYCDAEEAEARFKGSEGFTYTRYGNPTLAMLEERMAALECMAVTRATASGMAAVTAALLCYLRTGDHVVAAKAMFGSCRYVIEDVLARFGIAHTLVDGEDTAQWQEAVRTSTRLFFLETPANPTLSIVDLKAVCAIAASADVKVVVDNAFATPVLQRPVEFGAEIVVHSSTKYVDGQGRCLGGLICCSETFLKDHLQNFLRHTGPAMSPFNAWVHLKSLETLELRMKEHSTNAAEIADFLADLRGIGRVLYPFRNDHPQHQLARAQMSGGGGVVTFEVEGGKAAAFRFANALSLIDISNNLGDAKSLVTHPGTTTHQRLSAEAREALGITEGTLRLSIGLEDPADLRDDLLQALKHI